MTLIVTTKVSMSRGKLASNIKGVKFQVQNNSIVVTKEHMSINSAKTGDLKLYNTYQGGRSVVNINGQTYTSNSTGSSVVYRNGETFINGVNINELKSDDDEDNEDEQGESIPPSYGYTFHDLSGIKFDKIEVMGRGVLEINDNINLSDNLTMYLYHTASVKFPDPLRIPQLYVETHDESSIVGDYHTFIDTLLVYAHDKSKIESFKVNDKVHIVATWYTHVSISKVTDNTEVLVKGRAVVY